MSTTRIDVHHHFLTPQYIDELAHVGVLQSGGIPFPKWMPEDSLAVMDRYAISTALLSLSSPGLCFGNSGTSRDVARALNEFAAQAVTRSPQRFGFFSALPLPDVEASLAEIAYALDILHADGIGLLSNTAGIYLGDPSLDPIFAELDHRSSVVFLHPTVFTGSEIPSAKNAGSPIPNLPGFMLEFVFDTTRAVANLILSGTIKRYPHIRFILSHAGGTVPYVSNKIVSGALVKAYSARTQNVQSGDPAEMGTIMRALHDDVFSQLQSFYYDTALSANPNALSSLLQLVPSSHILLGTDYPFAPEAESGNNLRALASYSGFNQQDIQNIESNNALQLFPRLQA